MDYSDQLSKEHSRINTDLISRSVGDDPKEFKKIIDIIYSGKAPLPQRASWLLMVVSRKHPELIAPYTSLFINTINDFKIDGIKRNMLTALTTQKVPKKLEGKLVNICFDFILSRNEMVAVKTLSLEILSTLIVKYPELKNELRFVIIDQISKTSIAFQAKGKKLLELL